MANPTTNFGWVMPNSADLVTDLPADFAVFGQGVDTSMQYLLGGTTGQVLSKTSGTNMAFTWIANDQGDLTAITAGTGISVTSGTGPIPTVGIDTAVTVDKTTAQTLTNKTLTSPALTTPTISTATTNGDILYGTGSGALARLGIGSSAQVLTVASGIPSWATPSTTFVGCSLQKATQSLTTGTWVALTWNVETNDSNNFHDNATNNSRVTIPAGYAGRYLITTTINYDQSSGVGARYVGIYKNGSNYSSTAIGLGAGGVPSATLIMTYTDILNLSVADYVEIYGHQTTGGALSVNGNASGVGISNFNVTYLGA